MFDTAGTMLRHWAAGAFALGACCIVIGTVAGALFGRVGAELGFIIGGVETARNKGARCAGLIAGGIVGLACGAALGAATGFGPAGTLACLLGALGIIPGAVLGGHFSERGELVDDPITERARMVVWNYLGMDLETALGLACGGALGLVCGAVLGATLAPLPGLSRPIRAIIAAPAGALLGASGGLYGARHGRLKGMITGMIAGVLTGTIAGLGLAWISQPLGEPFRGAIGGALAGSGYGLIGGDHARSR